MKRILEFGASNSSTSINAQLATWAASQVEGAEVTKLDLNNFEMPIYSMDREKESGIPQLAQDFKKLVADSDGIIISFAEHNGSYSTAFKNIFDWMSRLGRPIWSEKPMLLLATSPGPRGGQLVLDAAVKSFLHQGGGVTGNFSLPSFGQNFSSEQGIINPELLSLFKTELEKFTAEVENSVGA